MDDFETSSLERIERKSALIQVMRRAIILLPKILENNMFKYAARIEGLYDLLVQEIPQIRKHLQLSTFLGMLIYFKVPCVYMCEHLM